MNGMARSPRARKNHTYAEAEEDSDSAESRQRIGMHVAVVSGNCDQRTRKRKIAHVPCQDERRQQAGKKHPQTDQGQLRHLDTGDY